MSPIPKSDIPTPAALIDREVVLQNIKRAQDFFSSKNIAFRPHIKTHKLPEFAHAQLQAGAIGINAQKISEAEVFADAGVDDILITYNILGQDKLARLHRLSLRVKKLAVTVDSVKTIEGLAAHFDASHPIDVMIECDTGGSRAGVQSPEEALKLAYLINKAQGLRFRGLMTYPAKNGAENVQNFMDKAETLIENAGMTCTIISSGGTPDIWKAHHAPIVNEYRAGTYIYNDRSLIEGGYATIEDCAFRVLATVVSTPTDTRAIIDAGSKTLSSDLIGLEDYGLVVGHEYLRIKALSEEHGTLEGAHGFKVGERIEIIPNHVCVVSNLLDEVWISEGQNFIPHNVAARGKIV